VLAATNVLKKLVSGCSSTVREAFRVDQGVSSKTISCLTPFSEQEKCSSRSPSLSHTEATVCPNYTSTARSKCVKDLQRSQQRSDYWKHRIALPPSCKRYRCCAVLSQTWSKRTAILFSNSIHWCKFSPYLVALSAGSIAAWCLYLLEYEEI
jgi:hypothetical protein